MDDDEELRMSLTQHRDYQVPVILSLPKLVAKLLGGPSGTRVIEADGTRYPGQIKQHRRRQHHLDGNGFYQTLYSCADGRWFDNAGTQMEPPDAVEAEAEE